MYQKGNRQVMGTGLHNRNRTLSSYTGNRDRNRTLSSYVGNIEVIHTPTRSTSTGSHAASNVLGIYQSEGHHPVFSLAGIEAVS